MPCHSKPNHNHHHPQHALQASSSTGSSSSTISSSVYFTSQRLSSQVGKNRLKLLGSLPWWTRINGTVSSERSVGSDRMYACEKTRNNIITTLFSIIPLSLNSPWPYRTPWSSPPPSCPLPPTRTPRLHRPAP